MKKFLIEVDKNINIGLLTAAFKKGEYQTKDETEIKALMGAKNVSLIGEGEEPEKVTEDTDKSNEELLRLQAEYTAKLGKKPHHNAGVDKLKALIADFDNQQEG